MPFALQPPEPLVLGIRRLLSDQLTSAIRHLATQQPHPADTPDPVEAVHETRKCMKRVRTLVRLLRRTLGTREAAELNARLRQLGHLLAPIRDAHMLLEATTRLAQYAAHSPFGEAVDPVRAALQQQHPPQPLPEDILRAIVPELQSIAEELDARLIDVSERSLRRSLRAGLRRLLRRGRRAFALAYSAPADAHFHNWRKRVKDIYYTACLLHPTRPQKLAPFVDALDLLSEELGDEHDLGLLASRLHSEPVGSVVAVALTLQLIARRREELRADARPRGEALYRRPPKELSRWLTRGLKSDKKSDKKADAKADAKADKKSDTKIGPQKPAGPRDPRST